MRRSIVCVLLLCGCQVDFYDLGPAPHKSRAGTGGADASALTGGAGDATASAGSTANSSSSVASSSSSTAASTGSGGGTPTGSLLWAKRFGDVWSQRPNAIAVDSSGNILVTGRFGGTMDFGCSTFGFTSGTVDNAFLVKLDPDGNCMWSKSYGDDDQQGGSQVATDASGVVTLTGYYHGVIDFTGAVLTNNGATPHVFVARLDSGGNLLSAVDAGPIGVVAGGPLSVTEPNGDTVTAGDLMGSMTFGGTVTLTSAGSYDIFVAKYAP